MNPAPISPARNAHARYGAPPTWFWLLVLALTVLGAAIRLFDLTDPPYDFHTTRQLHSAIVARGMYYETLPEADPDLRERALAYRNAAAIYEPPLLERAAALTYRLLGYEAPWVARLYNSLFWVLGGIFLVDLARRMLAWGTYGQAQEGAGWGAAAVALGYYLLLPFAVQASRSFQPDPGMVVWMILALWALFRWSERREWRFALFAGFLSGIAVLVKPTAAFVLGPAFAALVLYEWGWKRVWVQPQVWAAGLLMLAPTSISYLTASGSVSAATYFENTTGDLLHMLFQPTFYIGWFHFVQGLVGFTVLALGLVGLLLAPPRARWMLIAIWAGYLLYGAFFPYQMATHNYYHLRLVPILALSIVPVAQAVLAPLLEQGRLARFGLAGVGLLVVGYALWASYSTLSKVDYRQEPARWQAIGASLPADGKIVALTQDYGFSLMYYGWRKVDLWPPTSELRLKSLRGNTREFEQLFNRYTKNKDYFLVTDFDQLEAQPELQETLDSDYTLLAENENLLLYDLNAPRVAAP